MDAPFVMNYFDLFDVPAQFEVDLNQLATRYRDLQRTVHPDKFAGSSEQEQLLAVQKTAQVNDGYQTLKSPIRRAEHLLALAGIDLSHETTTVKDMGFLMQQMEWREAIAEIKGESDPHAQIAELHDSFADYSKTLTAQLAQLLADNEFVKAADEVRKLKFMAKLQAELEQIEDSLFE